MKSTEEGRAKDLDSFHSWLMKAVHNGPVAVVTGKNGDMDTVGSAIALAASHPRLMACGLHLGRLAKKMVQHHQAPFRKLNPNHRSWPKDLAGVVVVDAAAETQTGLNLPDVPKCILDHHATNEWELDDEDLFLQWDVKATTELVSEYLFLHSTSALTPQVCEFLIAGLITDTGRFRHANHTSFSTAGKLIHHGDIDYQSFIEFLEEETISPSERGAILRGMNRAEITEAGPWCVVRTRCGTLEGKVASLLVSIGADAVVVTRQRDGETRLTVRAPRSSVKQGIHLGNIMADVAKKIGGDGGGHDGAAGWSGSADPIAAESAFIDAVARTKRTE